MSNVCRVRSARFCSDCSVVAVWERAINAAFTRERKLEDDLGLDTNETTVLDVVFARAELLLLDIHDGTFLPLGFFVGVGFNFWSGGDDAVLLLTFALRSAISLRIESCSFEMKEAIESIPFSCWRVSNCASACNSV